MAMKNEQLHDAAQTDERFPTPKSGGSTKKKEVAAFNTLRERERLRQRVLCLRQQENLHVQAQNLYKLYDMRVYEAYSERAEYVASKQRIRQNKQSEASYRRRRAQEQRGSHVEQLVFAKQTCQNCKQQSVAAFKDEYRELRELRVANVREEREKIAACHEQLYLNVQEMRCIRSSQEMQKLEKIYAMNDYKAEELQRVQQEAENEIYRLKAEEQRILQKLATEKSAKKRDGSSSVQASTARTAGTNLMPEQAEDDTDNAFYEELKQQIESELREQDVSYPQSCVAEGNASAAQQSVETAAAE